MIDLDRVFVPLKPGDEPFDWGAAMGRKYGGWLGWDELITRPRVVLLAEARSGKTEEFLIRAAKLREGGKAGFFLRIEDLADASLLEGLPLEDEARFAAWKDGDEPGWFFLDSVDEARLNAKNFDRALRRFRRDVGPGLGRAYVFISCRVSDWKGKQDQHIVTSLLPISSTSSTRVSEVNSSSSDELLLRPIFDRGPRSTTTNRPAASEEALTIVRLAELTTEQRSALARWAGVADPDTFVRAIARHGLNNFAERPGDLLELAEYWKEHGRFDSFAEMTGFAVDQKLAERGCERPDADLLSDIRAREGAERLAAALTLGKSFTLRVPGQDADPTLAAGALDPVRILPDWKSSERAALLRRGVFTPATYGRLRFHHRSTQEYLTAQWLHRLRQRGCPRSEVMRLLFVEPYGVRTAVPSMRPVAAWLALTDVDVRNELIEREPLELIRHGDPRSLPLPVRERLLMVYADRQLAGEVPEESVDHLSLWMFAEPALGPVIRAAWTRNADPSFRIQLLRLVREGAVADCVDLARGQSLDMSGERYLRHAAIAAMVACADLEGLACVADHLMADPSALSARDAADFARHLYPTYLSRTDLVRLIDKAQPAGRSSLEGFPYALKEFWNQCPRSERPYLLEELADLCLGPPFVSEYRRISAKHRRLAPGLVPLAADLATTLGNGLAPMGLVKACAAVERSVEPPGRDEYLKLRDTLSGRRQFHRQLFWFDVNEARLAQESDVTRYWQLGVSGSQLWVLTADDADWLVERIRDETVVQDRQIALSVLVQQIGREGLKNKVDELRVIVDGVPELESDLAAALSPPPSNREREVSENERLAIRQQNEHEAREKQSWLDFASSLRADSSHLRDPIKLADRTYSHDLDLLTYWLIQRTGNGAPNAARQWPLLAEAFGHEVAHAYRDGMKLLWRLTVPRTENATDRESSMSAEFRWLCFSGIGLEADEGEGWADRLTGSEAERAVLHAFSVRELPSEWMAALACRHPDHVKPIIAGEVASEWAATSVDSRLALEGIAEGGDRYRVQMADVVIDLFSDRPGLIRTLNVGLRVLARVPLTAATQARLIGYAERELQENTSNDERALRYIALLFICNPASGLDALERWLATADSDGTSKGRGERALGALFSRHWPIIPDLLEGQPVDFLKRMTMLAYRTVRLENDVPRDTPDQRDEAESARNRVLEALLKVPGRETYEALHELALDSSIASRAKRFRELAHRRAEQDAEMSAWSASEVVAFEERHVAPAKSGGELFRIALAILDDIQTRFIQADASSRPVLSLAKNEDQVQQWLAEQFTLQSKERFVVNREVEVANSKLPDILLSSTQPAVQVAVEIKHSGKHWTVRQLENALRKQLAEDYLREANRRHGILVITHHEPRTWIDPDTGLALTFEQLLARLRGLASTLQHNETGAIEVAVVGLDASRTK